MMTNTIATRVTPITIRCPRLMSTGVGSDFSSVGSGEAMSCRPVFSSILLAT